MKDSANTRTTSVKDRCNRLKIKSYKMIRNAAQSDDVNELSIYANYILIRLAEGDEDETIMENG